MDDGRRGASAGDGERITPAALYRAVLLAFALLVVVLVFPVIASLLLLVLLIVIVAVPMSAATGWLELRRVPRAVGAPLVLLTVVAVVGGIVAVLVPVFVSEGNRLVDALPATVDHLRRDLGRVTHSSSGTSGHALQRFVDGYTSHPQKLLGPATAVGAGVAGVLTTLVVVALTALYSAIQPRSLVRGIVSLVAPPRRAQTRRILRRLAHAYLGWLRGLGLGMLVLFAITYAGLLAVQLPFAIVFATLTALAMVVPYYGALVSAIPPVLLALTFSPGKALIVAGLYLLSHQVEGNVIEPLVMARAVELHPALVAIGVIAVERLFGFIGLLVAVPILVTFKVLVEELWVRPLEAAYGGESPEEPPPRPAGRWRLRRSVGAR
jgi:predicted PurR-regulated permease PerM